MAKKRKRKKSSSPAVGCIDRTIFPDIDARTLAEAEQIKADGKRFLKAQKASKKLMKEKADEIAGLKKVLKGL